MNEYSIVYLGPFDRAPFFGGTFWFDKDVPQSVRGDLAAQLLFTKTTDGGPQFQLASEADFNGMLFDGFIAAGTPVDGLVWAGGAREVAPAPVDPTLMPPDGVGDPSQAKAAILGDASTSTDETNGGNGETNAAGDETVEGDGGTDANADGTGDAGAGADATNADGTDASATPASTRSSRRTRNTGAQA